MTATASPSPSMPRLTPRQEEFCQAMAAGVGGAEAARRAGYSPNGAKQRGAFLMRQPEIRLRIDAIRAARRQLHQTRLDEAEGQIATIIGMALDSGRPSLALRAVELRLRLCGVIQDKRIAYHYQGSRDGAPHPDADLEQLAADPEEELDPLRFRPGPTREPVAEDAGDAAMMTDDDLSAPSVPSTPAELPAPAPAQPAEPAPQASPEPGASRSAAARRSTAIFSASLFRVSASFAAASRFRSPSETICAVSTSAIRRRCSASSARPVSRSTSDRATLTAPSAASTSDRRSASRFS